MESSILGRLTLLLFQKLWAIGKRNILCAVQVGDGNSTNSEGKKEVEVVLKGFGLKHTRIVMDTIAFDVCIGMNFFRANPEYIVAILFTPSHLIVRNPKTQQGDLVQLEECYGSSRLKYPLLQLSPKCKMFRKCQDTQNAEM